MVTFFILAGLTALALYGLAVFVWALSWLTECFEMSQVKKSDAYVRGYYERI